MPFRFRKSFKIAPGVKINLSKGGISTSLGGKGHSINIGKRGVTQNVGIPGSGLSYRSNITNVSKSKKSNHPECKICKRSDSHLKLNDYGICGNCMPTVIACVKSQMRVLNESVRLVDNSKNLPVRIKRCDLIIRSAKELMKFEEIGIDTVSPHPSKYIDFYSQIKAELEKSADL